MDATSRLKFLRPSGAATWIECSGYVAMRATYPEAPEESNNDVREDGTAAHWLAEQLWHGKYPPLDSLSPNGRVLDEEMFDGADLYIDTLRSLPTTAPVMIEQTLDCSVVYPGMTGTPDAYAIDVPSSTVYLADFKYGFRFVEVWWNWQLLCYAKVIVEALLKARVFASDTNIKIVFIIVQPRCNHRDGPVRTWTVQASELRAHFNILTSRAEDAMKPNAPCKPNPGCGDCAGRHACVALQNSAAVAIERSFDGIPLELDGAAIGTELLRLSEAAKRIEARMTGLQGQAEAMLREGKVVNHWTLAPTYARERWREECESHVVGLGSYYNVDLAAPPKPISVAKARKLLPASIMAAFTHKPSTGVRLTRQDPYEARKKFQPTNRSDNA